MSTGPGASFRTARLDELERVPLEDGDPRTRAWAETDSDLQELREDPEFPR